MTDANQDSRPTEGNRVRQAGVKAVKPRDAATLFIIRRDGPKPRVLMGKRHGGHDFMANLWVFPGGRVDKTDFKGPFATDLRPEVAAKFQTYVSPGKARALGLAAIRETFEEAGLLLAKPVEARPALGPWREFMAHGAAPDLEALSLVYRAVTPPMLAKRFDTWFLMADAERLVSLERQPDCGELEEIAWFDFQEALDLKLPMVTRSVITEVMAQLEEPGRPIPYMRFRSGPTKPRIL